MANLAISQISEEDIRAEIQSANIIEVIKGKMSESEFMESALYLLSSPQLSKCTKQSVLGGLLKAAIFGFRVSTELGQCWLIPRTVKTGRMIKDQSGRDVEEKETVAVFQIGYKGWQELAFRSGAVESFDYGTVHENDTFDFQQGTSPYLNFKPSKINRGKKTHFFATATLSSGRVVFDVITIDEAESYRRMSDTQIDWVKDGNRNVKTPALNPKGIWAENYDAMALRLPIREICTKKVPKSTEILKAIDSDGGASVIGDGKIIDITPSNVMDSEEKKEDLHEDLLAEIDACKTRDELKQVYHRQKVGLPEYLVIKLYTYCTSAGLKLSE